MDPLDIKKEKGIVKPVDEKAQKKLERGFSHAFDILQNMKDLKILPGENFATAMKRIWDQSSAEMKKRAAQDNKNDAAQAAFDKLNNKKKLDEGNKTKE